MVSIGSSLALSVMLANASQSSTADDVTTLVTVLCPPARSCTHSLGVDSLDILCNAVNQQDNVARDLDALLRTSNAQLTSLNISNTQLKRIPEAICNLTALTQLRLDNNQLNALPDNCLLRLSALKVFSAFHNRIAHL